MTLILLNIKKNNIREQGVKLLQLSLCYVISRGNLGN